MPYFISAIIAIVSATVILLTRFEGDNSSVISELERVKKMMLIVDGYVDTYLEARGSIPRALTTIYTDFSAKNLEDSALLLNGSVVEDDTADANIKNLYFPSDTNKTIAFRVSPEAGSTSISSYTLSVQINNHPILSSRLPLVKSYLQKEVCENRLFAKVLTNTANNVVSCVVYK